MDVGQGDELCLGLQGIKKKDSAPSNIAWGIHGKKNGMRSGVCIAQKKKEKKKGALMGGTATRETKVSRVKGKDPGFKNRNK